VCGRCVVAGAAAQGSRPSGAGGACEGVVRAHATAGPPPALRLDLEVLVQAARRRPIQISDGARLIARPSGGSRDPLDTRVGGPSLAERNPTHPPLCRPAIRTASAAGPQRCLLQQTDGVGFKATNDFRRCRFSRSAKALRVLPARTPLDPLVNPVPQPSYRLVQEIQAGQQLFANELLTQDTSPYRVWR
jgi:hypothetical protein